MASEGKITDPPPVISQKDLKDAVIVGASAGGAGFVIGATAGVLRGTRPILFGLGSGLQFFGLGTLYWTGRSAVLSAWYSDRTRATSKDRLWASTIGGGFAGVTMALLTRGRSNALPGGIMFSLFGAAGQGVYNTLDSRHTARVESGVEKQTMTEWFTSQKWSPVSVLTDTQYEEILKEKILKVDVEISLIDDRIQQMKQAAHEAAAANQQSINDS